MSDHCLVVEAVVQPDPPYRMQTLLPAAESAGSWFLTDEAPPEELPLTKGSCFTAGYVLSWEAYNED